jgi:hypothetical protein
MSQEQINITDMQCRIYRMAQRKWNITPADCTKLFRKYHIFGFIADCYDMLHLASYDCALRDVEEILQSNGVSVCES